MGVVLRSEDLAENDRRLTLYTREFGKVRAKVIGVRKTASKLRVLTMPFAESSFQLYLHGTRRSGARDPGKVVGGEVVRDRSLLREEWDRMVQGSAVCETLDALTHPGYPNPQEYDLLAKTLDDLEVTASPVMVRLRFTLILLRILGYGIRHHAAWKSYTEDQRDLLLNLARWDARDPGFLPYEVQPLERLVGLYLSNYLTRPLKTEVFQQKLNASAGVEPVRR